MDSALIASRIKLVCRDKGISIKKLLEETKTNRNLIYQLEKNISSPSVESLSKLADYLGCSVDYLLGKTDKPEVNR